MDFGSLPLSIVRLIDRVCDEFEIAWRAGSRPRIEDHLSDVVEPGRSALLQALLASELESRRGLGERPSLGEYLARFPADAELVRILFKPDTSIPRRPPVATGAAANEFQSSAMFHSPARTVRPTGVWTWVWPLAAALLLVGAGVWLFRTIERVTRSQVASELLALRDADVEALKLLLDAQEAVASIAASDPRVRTHVLELIESGERGTAALLRSPVQAELRSVLATWLGQYEYDGFRVLDRQGRSVASWRDLNVGGRACAEEIEALDAVFAGRSTVSRPRPSDVPLLDFDGKERAGLPTMFVLAPVRRDDGLVIAALGFRMRPERTFTRVLNVARFGRSGETFAFDRAGLLLSESRFDDELKHIGLIANAPHVRSTLSLELRDPGVDMTTGARPVLPRKDQPFTRLVEEAMLGRSGVDVEGARDYRGVPVIGAWTWLPEYGFGVITKVDRAEAFRPLVILHAAFWTLFALLATSAIGLFIFTVVVSRLRRRMRTAIQDATRLGQYTLDAKIGEGGMGVVYRAHHAMLRRPTAVKLLRPDKTNEKSIARFEREVQLTSELTHPNTVTIYDFGRTPEGIFYYAMEYLDGIDLQALVTRHGPQPESRVIHILAQVCGSLAEAHGIGLIHRDVKPSNIILTHRGALFDFAKLVDFGLVKAVDSEPASGLTTADSLVGTPRYMAPEAIRLPDQAHARSDLYSIGAVGYFLLTGRPPFDGRTIAEIVYQHMSVDPDPPSAAAGRAVSPELESLLLSCLSKEPTNRPESASALADSLSRIPAGAWSRSQAQEWWRQSGVSSPAHLSSADTRHRAS